MGAKLYLRTDEVDDIVDRSLLIIIGREGHTVYMRNLITNEASPIPGAIGITREQAERYVRLLRWHIAGIITVLHASEI